MTEDIAEIFKAIALEANMYEIKPIVDWALKQIDRDHSQIHVLEIINSEQEVLPSLLSRLKHVRHVEFRNSVIPQNLHILSHIQSLTIRSTISEIPNSIRKLEALDELQVLDCHDLAELPAYLGEIPNIRKLVVSNNHELESIETVLEKALLLEKLEISRNRVIRIPQNIRYLRNLRVLYISSNQTVEEIPDIFEDLIQLEDLKITYNHSLKVLPNSLTKLANIKFIEISHNNQLKEFPPGLGIAESMEFENSMLKIVSQMATGDLPTQSQESQFPQEQKYVLNLRKISPLFPPLSMPIISSKAPPIPGPAPGFPSNPLQELHKKVSKRRELVNKEEEKYQQGRKIELEEIAEFVRRFNEINDIEIKDVRIEQRKDGSYSFYLSRIGLGKLRLPEYFMEKITKLELAENKLQADVLEGSGLQNMSNLRYLDLGQNQLKSIPKVIFQLHNLKYLDLQGNMIDELDDQISSLSELGILNLSANRLSSIPESICHLPRLKKLIMPENKIEKLMDCLGNFSELEYLDLGKNQIKFIPGIQSLVKLQHLNLRNNELTIFPDPSGMVELQHLDLTGNQIALIPAGIASIENLEYLGLNNNQIDSIPDSIAYLKILRKLELQMNQIQKLPDSITQMKSLNYLYLDSNPLEYSKQLKEIVRSLAFHGCMVQGLDFTNLESEFQLMLREREKTGENGHE